MNEDNRLIKLMIGLAVFTAALFVGYIVFQPASTTVTTTTTTAIHWSYEGEEGPEHWGELDPSYESCTTGQHQSPIDITQTDGEDLVNLQFLYKTSQVNILNNGHTVQLNYDPGSFMQVNNQVYELLQFHYHAPSEHRLDGELFPAEFHLVHKNSKGELAVVGILLRAGAENPAFQPFIENLPAEKSEETTISTPVNAWELLPIIQTTYRYSGSLTTPPCTEGVSWFLMTNPVEVSLEQIIALEELFEEGNNRPVQPIFERLVVEDQSP